MLSEKGTPEVLVENLRSIETIGYNGEKFYGNKVITTIPSHLLFETANITRDCDHYNFYNHNHHDL